MRVGNAVSLHRNWEFRRTYYRGRSVVHPALVSYCFKSKGKRIRVGVTAAKKVGGAVQRNRARRIIKEAYRSVCSRVCGGWDLVFVARTATLDCKSTDVARIMEAQLKKAGVIQ